MKEKNNFSKITIYPDTIKDIGGYTEVQEVFGIMTGSRDYRTKKYLRDANIQGIRNSINWLPGIENHELPTFAKGNDVK